MKKILSIIFVLCIIVSCFTTTAFAANETEASTTIQYTVEAGYTVSIPATVSLNANDYIQIYASNVSLDPNKKLYVAVDRTKTSFTQDSFYLSNGTSQMPCDVWVGSQFNEEERIGLYDTDYVVAVFQSGYMEPTQYGKLYITPHPNGFSAGVYTGTIYFEIYTQ